MSNHISHEISFRWQDYIHVSEDFTAQERAKVERALDALSHYPDPANRNLMLAAFNNYSEKITIAPSTNDNIQLGPIIGINFSLSEAIRIKGNDGAFNKLSLEATIEHELYHAADKNLCPSYNRMQFETVLRAHGKVPEKDMAPIMQEMAELDAKILAREWYNGLRVGKETTPIPAPFPNPYKAGSKLAEYKEAIEEAYAEAYAVPADIETGKSAFEEAATRYVDESSRKNRPHDPIRGHYTNFIDSRNLELLPSAMPRESIPAVSPNNDLAKSLCGFDVAKFQASVYDDQPGCGPLDIGELGVQLTQRVAVAAQSSGLDK